MVHVPALEAVLANKQAEYVMRMPSVEEATALKKAQIYRLIQQGDFPRPIALSKRAVGWLSSEIAAWIEARKAERDQNIAA